jgi:hypothetical protein
MSFPYFILTNNKKYLKPDGTLSDKKEEAATYSYNKNDNSVTYQDSNSVWKPSNPYFRDQVCPNNCNGHGYCKSGKCVCLPGWNGTNCETANSTSSSGTEMIVGIIIGILVLLGAVTIWWFLKKKQKPTDTTQPNTTQPNNKPKLYGGVPAMLTNDLTWQKR